MIHAHYTYTCDFCKKPIAELERVTNSFINPLPRGPMLCSRLGGSDICQACLEVAEKALTIRVKVEALRILE